MTIITSLISGPGRYSGTGINHEGEAFLGTMVVQRLLNDMGVMLHYEATVSGDHRVHAESTLLAPDMEGASSALAGHVRIAGRIAPPGSGAYRKIRCFCQRAP